MENHFTCITCKLKFTNSKEQRAHYQTAWHCYNLKRKVRGLPSVSFESFTDKIDNLKDVGTVNAGRKRNKKNKREFNKQRGATNKLNGTKKAIMMEKALEKRTLPVQKKEDQDVGYHTKDVPIVEVEEKNTIDDIIEERLRVAKPIPITYSLFDKTSHSSMKENISHMQRNFGFFIPDKDYLSDLEGLLSYLGEKVGIGYTCLWCERSFLSLEASQRHMIDTAHCKIKFYGREEEFVKFYDWPSEVLEGDEEDINSRKREPHYTENGMEVMLPSGAIIGHRALQLYYRQNHRAVTPYNPVWRNKTYRYNEKDHETINRKKDEYMRLGIKANKLQAHFRLQNPI